MFEEISYTKDIVDLKKMIKDGTIYVVRNYKPLKDFIYNQNILAPNNEQINNISPDKLIEINKKLMKFKEDGVFPQIFLEFITSNKINFSFSQLDIGNPRIVFPEVSMKSNIQIFDKLINQKESSFRRHLSPPHRDLNRPHYNSQFNFWWAFHDLKEDESLVFFPDSLDKQIFPYMKGHKLDANAQSEEFANITSNFSYYDYKLGEPVQCYLNRGDFLFFNSEHYHCSAKKVNTTRFSCELRFVDKSFDNNDHYMKDSFYYLKNYQNHKNENLFELYKNFKNLKVEKQKEIFFKFDEDIKIKLLSNDELKFKLNFFQCIKIFLQIRSFYFLEKFLTFDFVPFKFLLKIKLYTLSKDFLKNHFKFHNNHINYFIKGHHGFNQPTPNIFQKEIDAKISEISVGDSNN